MCRATPPLPLCSAPFVQVQLLGARRPILELIVITVALVIQVLRLLRGFTRAWPVLALVIRVLRGQLGLLGRMRRRCWWWWVQRRSRPCWWWAVRFD